MKSTFTRVAQSPSLRDASRPAEIRELFRRRYGEDCRLFRAPGRVNLIGEHTDYNDGFVMPAAIDFSCWVGVAPAADRVVQVHSCNFDESRAFDLDRPQASGDWSDYVQGVAFMLEKSGYRLPGARMLVFSEVPIGGGLSSSAALEVAAGLGLLDLQLASWTRSELAQACRQAENEFVGARCGIMDQFVSCHGKAGHLVLLDCRSLEQKYLALPADASLVICNTMVKHAIAAGEYNVRRAQCEEGVRLLSSALPGLLALRNLPLEDLERFRELLPPAVHKRCRHVVSENQRVLAAAAALADRDLELLGKLMAASHQSLRDDYEVSSRELDLMVELANGIKGVYGARMTGAGFGGCTINLVDAEAVPAFTRRISEEYRARLGIVADVCVATAADGAGPWESL
jgi:galactokinase